MLTIQTRMNLSVTSHQSGAKCNKRVSASWLRVILITVMTPLSLSQDSSKHSQSSWSKLLLTPSQHFTTIDSLLCPCLWSFGLLHITCQYFLMALCWARGHRSHCNGGNDTLLHNVTRLMEAPDEPPAPQHGWHRNQDPVIDCHRILNPDCAHNMAGSGLWPGPGQFPEVPRCHYNDRAPDKWSACWDVGQTFN